MRRLTHFLEQVCPRAFEGATEAVEVVNGHVPLACFDSLKGAAVYVSKLGQFFLSKASFIANAVDVSPYDDVGFGCTRHICHYEREGLF